MDGEPALYTAILIIVCIGLIVAVAFTMSPSAFSPDTPNIPLWELDDYYEQKSIEKLLCLEYGGIWDGDLCDNSGSVSIMPEDLQVEWRKMGTQLYVTGYGATGEINCKENYVLVKNTFGGISLPTCIETSYYDAALCAENERISWHTSGFVCHPLSTDQLILKNQEKIIKLLEDDLK